MLSHASVRHIPLIFLLVAREDGLLLPGTNFNLRVDIYSLRQVESIHFMWLNIFEAESGH